MSLSQIAKTINASPTLKLNEKAAILRQKGDPIIHLGGGEPKSKAPMDALIAAAAHLNSGEVRYAPADGIPELKKAIIRYTEEFYNRKVAPENVMASGGAKQAIMVALQAILNPQEEVIYPAPFWVSYPDMAKLCGAIGVPVLPEDGTFYPRIEDIEQRVGSYTKAVIINSPNNPTGAMYSKEFISDIVQYCEKKDLYLIMDDIYHRLIFDGKKPINCYQFAKKQGENSKLILIKSKILLPQLNLTEEEKEDIEELEKRLKEYQIFKRVSVKIKELANKDSQSFSRSTKVSPSVVFFDPPRIDNKNLFKIFQEVLEKISNEEKEKNPKALVEKSVSIEEKIGEIKNELDKIGQIQFGVFLKKSKSKVEVIVSFLAMLELLKQKILEAQQDDNFTDIILIKKEAFV